MQSTSSFFSQAIFVLSLSFVLLPSLIAQNSMTLQPKFQKGPVDDPYFYSEAISIATPMTSPFIQLTGYMVEAKYTGTIFYRTHHDKQWSTWIPFTRYENHSNNNRPYYQADPLKTGTDLIQFKADRLLNTPLFARVYFPGSSTEEMNFSRVKRVPFNCSQPEYCGRSCWCPDGNCPIDATPVPTTVSHVIVHHSAGHSNSSDYQAVVRSYWDDHVNTRGWDDIGYNWLIDRNGIIYEGRGADKLGAHFSCMNEQTVGICLIGNFETASPTAEALSALKDLIAWVAANHQLDISAVAYHESSQLDLELISGHSDGGISMLACSSTLCPGKNLYKELPLLREEISAFACLEDVAADSMLTSITPPLPIKPIGIQPNPTSGTTTLTIEHNSDGTLQLFLHDILGKHYDLGREAITVGDNAIVRDLSNYPIGLYVLTSWINGRYQQQQLLLKD